MFMPIKSLGSSLGLPFLSQNEDEQLFFRVGKNGIKRLSGPDVIPASDEAYWLQYITLFDNPDVVYSLITVQDIRQTLQNQPKNLATLIRVLASHLFTLIPSDAFPTPISPTSIPLAQQLRRPSTGTTRQALNCLRVLGRVLAVVYESDPDDGGWSRSASPVAGVSASAGSAAGSKSRSGSVMESEEDEVTDEMLRRNFAYEVLWKRPVAAKPEEEEVAPATPVEVENGKVEEVAEGADPLSKEVEPKDREAEENVLPNLADRLFSCVVDLLFCAGFTVPEAVKGQAGDKINYVIWEKGVGNTHNIGSTPELDRNKTEVLRFLLILLSSTIYTSPHALPYASNRPLEYLTHSLERRLVLSLLCSWLNTAVTPANSNWGGNVPYTHLVMKSTEDRKSLIRMSLMALLVSLDHWAADLPRSPAETPGLGGGPAGLTSAAPLPGGTELDPNKGENAFKYFFRKLHRKEDFVFILDGIIGILEEHTAVTNNVLPGARKPVPYILEVFMLFWKLVDLNKRFRAFLIESGKTPDIVCYIVLCCLEMKDNPAHHGLLRMLFYILQTLSSDRGFGPTLNERPKLQMATKWYVQGTTADFLIVSMYSIATTPGLNPLFPAMTITISNIAPYMKNIGVPASTRLLQLFKAFSAPNFLLADEGHPRLVYYLLETFNGVLVHQLQSNPNLVYAILRSHQDFQELATFTLISGLREIQKRMLIKASAAKRDEKVIDRAVYDPNLPIEKAALLGGDDDRTTPDLSTPSSPNSLRPSDTSLTNPLYTPGEAEEDPMISAKANLERQKAAPKSEKAKGKMRERSDSASTLSIEGELHKLALGGIGPSGYVPTQEWVSSWQKGLPLDTILIAISELLPKVQQLQPATNPGPSRAVLAFLRSATLVDVLPAHQAHSPRKFQWSVASTIWLTSLLWGDIYVAALPNFNGTNVKLFGVKQAAPSRREQAIQNVSNKLMSFMGSVAGPDTGADVHPQIRSPSSSRDHSRRSSAYMQERK